MIYSCRIVGQEIWCTLVIWNSYKANLVRRETGASEMRDRVRDWSERGRHGRARSNLSKKSLRAVWPAAVHADFLAAASGRDTAPWLCCTDAPSERDGTRQRSAERCRREQRGCPCLSGRSPESVLSWQRCCSPAGGTWRVCLLILPRTCHWRCTGCQERFETSPSVVLPDSLCSR